MKLDQIVLKRFEELEKKMQQIIINYDGFDKLVNSESFHEWATSAINLLEGAFSKNSVHYQNFLKYTTNFAV